jgi:uncharacterized protein (TIGR02246 family)
MGIFRIGFFDCTSRINAMSWRSCCMVAGYFASAFFAANLSGAEPDRSALQTVVSSAAEKFAKAFAARDAKAIAALFTPEAEYVDSSGTVFHSRKAIEAEYAASFAATPPGKIDIEIISIRPVAEGLVVEDGVSVFQPTGEGPSSQTRYTATHVRQADGSWLLASVRELEPAAISPHDRLKSLAWLLGRWRQEGDGSLIDTEWKWSEDGSFLVSEFSAKQSSGDMLQGTQRVGWDGERQQFRSWVFVSTGGSADGWWTPGEDGTWSVQLNGVEPDGSRMATLLKYDRDGKDALVISQEQRVVNGQSLPAFSNRVVRQPPAPAKTAVRR